MNDLINFGPDEGDQKKQFNKLKHDLERWREVIVHGSSLLRWEKSFYPGITCGAVTVLFLTLWWMRLSVLTTVALVALCICAGDFALPLLLQFVFKPEHWTGTEEKRYEEACRQIYNAKVQVHSLWIRFRMAKEQKSTIFVVLVSSALLILAWIGSTINNLFLCYLITLTVVNYPGLCQYGVVDKVKGLLGGHLQSVMGMILGGGGGGCKKEN